MLVTKGFQFGLHTNVTLTCIFPQCFRISPLKKKEKKLQRHIQPLRHKVCHKVSCNPASQRVPDASIYPLGLFVIPDLSLARGILGWEVLTMQRRQVFSPSCQFNLFFTSASLHYTTAYCLSLVVS